MMTDDASENSFAVGNTQPYRSFQKLMNQVISSWQTREQYMAGRFSRGGGGGYRLSGIHPVY